MKKTLLVFSLVVLFSLIMATGVFAAEPIILNEENPVLDLTGKNIEGPIIVESGNVTIKGNGTVTSPSSTVDEETEDYCTILVKGGNLTIEGGTYISDTGWGRCTFAALYVKENGTVTVNGGTFEGKGKDFAVRACAEKTTVEGGATLTINGGTFHSEWVTGLADCGATININGGRWTSESVWNGVSDVLNSWAMSSGELGEFVVKGGTFVNFDPTNVYAQQTNGDVTYVDTVSEGYVFDDETGKVACPHTDCEEHKEVAATYEATGTKAYWSCNTCSKWFEDEDATKEITDKDSIVIPKLVKVEEEPKEDEEKPTTGEETTLPEDDKTTIGEGTAVQQPTEDEKDETPKTGSVDVVLFASAIVSVISVAGIVTVKKYAR